MTKPIPLLVKAHMQADLCGEPPHLDGLLEATMAIHQGHSKQPGSSQVYAPGTVRIPIIRRFMAGQLVACCSSPLYAWPKESRHIDPVAVGNRDLGQGTQAVAQAIPQKTRVIAVDTVYWFVLARNPWVLQKTLRQSVKSIGLKRDRGFGEVAQWTVTEFEQDFSWFMPVREVGTVLMRPLPYCRWLPRDLIGAERKMGPCQPPYWHPDREMEIVEPV